MSDPLTPVTLVASNPPSVRRARQWCSRDGKRAFLWTEVIGHAYHEAGAGGSSSSSLYLYLGAGIFRLTGTEADEVFRQLGKR